MDFLTKEEKEIIKKHEHEEQMKRSNEILIQNIEYNQSLYDDMIKEIEKTRKKEFDKILSSFNFEIKDILKIEDQKLLRIPISMMTENEKIRRKLIEDTFDNIKSGNEFFNYNKYFDSNFKIDYYYYNLKGYFVNLKTVYIDPDLELADVFVNYNNNQYKIPLNHEESMIIIKIFESKKLKMQTIKLSPDASEIKYTISLLKNKVNFT